MKRSGTFAVPATILAVLFGVAASCNFQKSNHTMQTNDTLPGTFGFDLAFLNRYQKTIILSDSVGKARVVLMPGWQARVMTSTAKGNNGFSYGWINYKLIESGQKTEHINAYGGEERLWLGPEGGQFSVYFAKGLDQDFTNWYVPAELDTEPFEVDSVSQSRASFSKKFRLVNYSGTQMDIGIERSVELLGRKSVTEALGMEVPDSVSVVAYQSDNVLINKGKYAWTRETGMLSVWMLSMLTPSPGITLFIPYRQDPEKLTGKILNDDYFGKVPADRLIAENGMIFFKADGKYRSKIGIPPQRALNFSGSYDAENRTLTLLWCDLPESSSGYVNSKWEIQQDPFSGDAINAYNDGPVEDGTQMGPFYELESSSPAADLRPGESLVHRQRIFHFEGPEDQLSRITEQVFGVTVKSIREKFKE
jgi:hypothetical protein